MKSNDPAREHCTWIDNNTSHVKCRYCGHTMWGITRFKDHLAGRRGDVIPCRRCPDEVASQMKKELEDLDRRREEREKRMKLGWSALRMAMSQPTPPPPAATNHQQPQAPPPTAIDDGEERSLMDRAIQDSLQTFEVEKNKALKMGKEEDEELEKALRESMRSYQETESKKKNKAVVIDHVDGGGGGGDGDEDEIEAALRESIRSYEQEQARRSSASAVGSSSANYDSDDFEIDFGSDFSD